MTQITHGPQWWDNYFLGLAEYVSRASKDPSTKVGAVLVQGKNVVGLGYNGFSKGVHDTEERLNTRELKYKYVVHAEVNAILMAGKEARGATLYVWPAFSLPDICHDCCKVAINAGVKEIVSGTPSPENAERAKRWEDSILIAKSMCDESGVAYRAVPEQV